MQRTVPIILLAGMPFRTYCLTYKQDVAQQELKADLQSMQETIVQLDSQHLDRMSMESRRLTIRQAESHRLKSESPSSSMKSGFNLAVDAPWLANLTFWGDC